MELMITVTIIGVLATIAIPKISGMIRKAQEGATIGRLASIRSAIGIYLADFDGVYPSDVTSLTVNGKYLKEIEATKLSPHHPKSASIINVASDSAFTDVGGYAYLNVSTDSNYGTLFVNCTHTDTKGSVWTTY